MKTETRKPTLHEPPLQPRSPRAARSMLLEKTDRLSAGRPASSRGDMCLPGGACIPAPFVEDRLSALHEW